MAGRFSRSWRILKTSASVLNQNKKLLVLPLLALVLSVGIIACFGAAYASLGLDAASEDITPMEAVLGFSLYLALYTVTIFFNTALVASVSRHFDGEEVTVGYGLSIASSRIGSILGYAIIAATVGILLRALEERLGAVGRFVAGLLGGAWAVITFLVVPVLVHRDIGPIDAVKESATLLKKTWGENIIANAGIGIVFALLYVPLVLVAVLLGFVAFGGDLFDSPLNQQTALALMGLCVALVLLLSLIQVALTGIYGAALYRYSSGDDDAEGPQQFPPDMLGAAFGAK